MPKSALGRGLSAIISGKSKTAGPTPSFSPELKKLSGVQNIATDRIKPNPHQPRNHFDEEGLKDLAASIKEHGVLQPLVASCKGDGFELLAGERRLMAAKQAGLSEVPVIVRTASEQQKAEVALVENIQRTDLNPIEQAKGFRRLMDNFNLTQEQIAKKVGKSRSGVANTLRLLDLPLEIQKGLARGKITEGHAKAILSLSSPEKQRALYQKILKQGLNVRRTEFSVRKIKVRPHLRAASGDHNLRALADNLTKVLGTKVEIKKSAQGGQIIVYYYSEEELRGVIERIEGRE